MERLESVGIGGNRCWSKCSCNAKTRGVWFALHGGDSVAVRDSYTSIRGEDDGEVSILGGAGY